MLQYASKKSYHTVEINRRLYGTVRQGSNARNVRVSGDRLDAYVRTHAHARAHARTPYQCAINRTSSCQSTVVPERRLFDD